MKWSQITECGPVRRRNEDWVCACPDLGFFAVADGMGGHRAGNIASKLALDVLEAYIRNDNGADRPVQARALLSEGIMRANEAIFNAASKNEEWQGMGSTLNACLLFDNTLIVANVGDSRALMLRGNKISRLTSDHSLVQELVDGGGITEEEAFNHPRRNVLTRALGIAPRVDVDVFEYNLVVGDRLLLCTDGLSGFVPAQRIGEIMSSAGEPDQVVHRLLQEAIACGSNDNITMIFLVVD